MMPALRPRQWNVVLVAVLVAGSLFIAATRVQPSPGVHSPAAQTNVLDDRCADERAGRRSAAA